MATSAWAAEFCAEVDEPSEKVMRDLEFNPDGWLALRSEPSMRLGKTIVLLAERDRVQVACSRRPCKGEWLRVSKAYRFDDNGLKCKISKPGWVQNRYRIVYGERCWDGPDIPECDTP
jgi:hypothetical protein